MYNEHGSVCRVVQDVLSSLSLRGVDGEVVVVDDGSTDGSGIVAAGLCSEVAASEASGCGIPVRLVKHAVNCGKGAAIKSGIVHSRGGVIVIHDCDGEYSSDYMVDVASLVLQGRADVAFGNRFSKSPSRSDGFVVPTRYFHHFGNVLISRLSSVFLHVDVSDVMVGTKAFRRSAVDVSSLHCDGFGCEVELTFRLLAGRHVWFTECFIRYDVRSSGSKLSKLDGLRSVWRVVVEVLRR